MSSNPYHIIFLEALWSVLLHSSAFSSASVTAGLNRDQVYARDAPCIPHELYINVALKSIAG